MPDTLPTVIHPHALTAVAAASDADDYKEVLVNGEAAQGLSGWTIIANGGNGWTVETGPGTSCPDTRGNANYATSYQWCRKSQLIDLVAAGLSPTLLDQGPEIWVADWVCGRSDMTSHYYLHVELRDANQRPIKTFYTGELATPIAPNFVYPWRQVLRVFANYGPGVRYVYFEHGGKDDGFWAGWYGAKMTGSSVQVATSASGPRNLIKNGDGAAGMASWNVIENGGNGWVVENVGSSCPQSAGSTNFATSYGWCRKSQLVDLVAAGYAASDLDTAPTIDVMDWMCGRSDAGSKYHLIAEIRDEHQNVLQRFDSGVIDTPLLPNFQYPFYLVAHTFEDYGPGARFVYFEHGGIDSVYWKGWYGAKMTGASVTVADPPRIPRPALRASEALPLSLAAAPTGPVRVNPTNVVPTQSICELVLTVKGERFDDLVYTGTGWITPTTGNYIVVATAAHNLFDRENGWMKSVKISPALNGTQTSYKSYIATGNQIQAACNFLAVDENTDTYRQSNWALSDYGAIVVPASAVDWPRTGIPVKVASDQELRALSANVTGYPGNAVPPSTMWKASGPLAGFDAKTLWYSTITTTGGVSGSPVYSDANQGVGIHVENNRAVRITQEVSDALNNWRTPLAAATQITKLQLLIQTGEDAGAGTDDTIRFTLLGKDFGDLDDTFLKSRNERGNIDLYDVSAKLKQVFPGGLTVGQLTNAQYTIARKFNFLSGWAYWFWGDWRVIRIVMYVNDQRFHSSNNRKWLTERDPTMIGTIRESAG